MKHPALARVFAVVLAILCLLMLANGTKGFGKAAAEYKERQAFAAKYAGRIDRYLALDAELSNSISYDEAYQELEKLVEEHDDAAAKHRTDTALYTAEKGGNTMGANLLWEYMAEVKGAKMQVAIAKMQFDGVEEAYAAVKGDIAQISAEAGAGAAAGSEESAALRAAIEVISGILAKEPKLPEGFVLPEDPGEAPQEPVKPEIEEPVPPEGERPTPPEPLAEDADEEAKAAWEQAQAEYKAALALWTAYDEEKAEYDEAMAEYEKALADYESYPARKEAYDEALRQQEEYEAAHAAWEAELAAAVEALPLDESMATLGQLSEDLDILASRTAEVLNTFQVIAASFGSDLGGMDDLGGADFSGVNLGALQQLAALSEMDLSDMTPEQMLDAGRAVSDALAALSAYFGDVTDPLAAIDKVVADTRYLLDTAEQALQKAEGLLYSQPANIWYNLGELEKDKEKLAGEKQALDEESNVLNKRILETDELKRLKNRHISAKQLLVSIPEVKRAFSESGDLVGSAQHYLEQYERETERLQKGKRLVNLLAVIGAVAGVIGIPAAYEKIKSRFMLIAPVAVCLVCAAAADGINMSLGLGQMYTALFTAIFALIHLLIVLPEKKSRIGTE